MSKRRQTPKTGLYFHYTSADDRHLGSILAEGRLRTTESNLSFETEHAGPDVVWLLADRMRRGDAHGVITPRTSDLKAHVEIAVRLTKADVAQWTTWAREHGISDRDFQTLAVAGGGMAQAQRWRVVEQAIERGQWESITYRPTGVVIPVTATEIPDEVATDHAGRFTRWITMGGAA